MQCAPTATTICSKQHIGPFLFHKQAWYLKEEGFCAAENSLPTCYAQKYVILKLFGWMTLKYENKPS